jgi:hypothetical protein
VDLALCIPLVGKGKNELTTAERAERNRYADQAMDALRRAVDNGYKAADRLRNDPELEPLRSRDDFKKLLGEVESKSKPGAGLR